MYQLLGQEELISEIDKYSLSTFPKASIFLGSKGCGKHLLCNYIKEKFNIDIIDMTNSINLDYILEIYSRSIPCLYIIDTNDISIKNQNMILKLLEEPLQNTLIILLAENKEDLLPTILNRCIIFKFKPYSIDILSKFINNQSNKQSVLELAKTPGQIQTIENTDIEGLKALCLKIIDKISQANYANTLTISDKLNYKDDIEKYDIYLFLDVLKEQLFSRYKQVNDKILIDMYLHAAAAGKTLKNKQLNKQYVIDNLLTDFWLLSRGL